MEKSDLELMDWNVFALMIDRGEISPDELIDVCSTSNTMVAKCNKNNYEIFRRMILKHYGIDLRKFRGDKNLIINPNINARNLLPLLNTSYFDEISTKILGIYYDIDENTGKMEEQFETYNEGSLNLIIPNAVIERFAEELGVGVKRLLKNYNFIKIIEYHININNGKINKIGNLLRSVEIKIELKLPFHVNDVEFLIKIDKEGESFHKFLINGILMDKKIREDLEYELFYVIYFDFYEYKVTRERPIIMDIDNKKLRLNNPIVPDFVYEIRLEEEIIAGEIKWIVLRNETGFDLLTGDLSEPIFLYKIYDSMEDAVEYFEKVGNEKFFGVYEKWVTLRKPYGNHEDLLKNYIEELEQIKMGKLDHLYLSWDFVDAQGKFIIAKIQFDD